MPRASTAAMGESPTAATKSQAQTSSWIDRKKASTMRTPPTLTARDQGDRASTPDAMTPRGNPMTRARVMPATA